MYMTAPADQPFNMDKNKEINPIHQLRLSTTDFVWSWYEEQFREAVRKHTGETNSEYKSLLITFGKHRDGERGMRGVLGMNIFLRRIIEKVYPITIPDDFFHGQIDAMKDQIQSAAERMTAAYEKEYQRQAEAITY